MVMMDKPEQEETSLPHDILMVCAKHFAKGMEAGDMDYCKLALYQLQRASPWPTDMMCLYLASAIYTVAPATMDEYLEKIIVLLQSEDEDE